MARLIRDPLLSAWLWLLALSALSTLLAAAVGHGWLTGLGVTLGGAAILTLAWAKARVILAQYLGLAHAPFWHRGFSITLALYALLLLGLYLIA